MFILYDIGLVLSLLIGGVIGLMLTTARYEQIAMRQRQYEAEVAEYQEVYAALALYRRVKQAGPQPTRHPQLGHGTSGRSGLARSWRPLAGPVGAAGFTAYRR